MRPAWYLRARALIDPAQSDALPGGGCLQDVSVVLGGGVDPALPREAAVALLPCQARELAFELLALAEQAERIGGGRR